VQLIAGKSMQQGPRIEQNMWCGISAYEFRENVLMSPSGVWSKDWAKIKFDAFQMPSGESSFHVTLGILGATALLSSPS